MASARSRDGGANTWHTTSPGTSAAAAAREEGAMKSRGMGRIFRRGGVWWIQYSFRGQQHRESSKSTSRAKAVSLLKRRLAEMGHGRLIGPSAERLTFG